MSTSLQVVSVIGCDPGPATGICFLDFIDRKLAGKTLLSVDGQSVQLVLEAMLTKYYNYQDNRVTARYAGVENFITGQSAGTKGENADITRQLVVRLAEQLQMWGYNTRIRRATDVKPWATDKRLVAAGIVGASSIHGKARDAYDGARHAMYTAKEAGVMSDPLR